MGIKKSAGRRRARNLNDSLPISGMTKDYVCCTSSSAWEKEVFTCGSTDYNGFNIHAWNAARTALLKAEEAKTNVLMEFRKKIIL